MPRPTKPTRTLPAPLTRAAQRFEKWRRTRTRPGIPGPLWDLATKLGGRYGVNRTATALHLDYYGLKRRVEEANGSDAAGAQARPTFLEVLPAAHAETDACRVELENPRGAKMTIHLKSAGPSELAALGEIFWRGER